MPGSHLCHEWSFVNILKITRCFIFEQGKKDVMSLQHLKKTLKNLQTVRKALNVPYISGAAVNLWLPQIHFALYIKYVNDDKGLVSHKSKDETNKACSVIHSISLLYSCRCELHIKHKQCLLKFVVCILWKHNEVKGNRWHSLTCMLMWLVINQPHKTVVNYIVQGMQLKLIFVCLNTYPGQRYEQENPC